MFLEFCHNLCTYIPSILYTLLIICIWWSRFVSSDLWSAEHLCLLYDVFFDDSRKPKADKSQNAWSFFYSTLVIVDNLTTRIGEMGTSVENFFHYYYYYYPVSTVDLVNAPDDLAIFYRIFVQM